MHCNIVCEPAKTEINTPQVYDILDLLAQAGCLELSLTGGEPFVRPDLLEILGHAKNLGFCISLLTNATLITPELADGVRDSGINKVTVSLYGATAATFDRVTGEAGSFEKCLRGIDLLRQRDIPLDLVLVALKLNIDEFAAMQALADERGLKAKYNSQIMPHFNGSRENLRHRLPPQATVDLAFARDPDLPFIRTTQVRDRKGGGGHLSCEAGRTSLAINPYGELNLCLCMHLPGFDLKTGNLEEGWRKLKEFAAMGCGKHKLPTPSGGAGFTDECGCAVLDKTESPDFVTCRKECELFDYCLQCPADALLECGDVTACVPRFREMAQLIRERQQK